MRQAITTSTDEIPIMSARLPYLSMRNPRTGLANAEIKYGVPYQVDAVTYAKPNFFIIISSLF